MSAIDHCACTPIRSVVVLVFSERIVVDISTGSIRSTHSRARNYYDCTHKHRDSRQSILCGLLGNRQRNNPNTRKWHTQKWLTRNEIKTSEIILCTAKEKKETSILFFNFIRFCPIRLGIRIIDIIRFKQRKAIASSFTKNFKWFQLFRLHHFGDSQTASVLALFASNRNRKHPRQPSDKPQFSLGSRGSFGLFKWIQ